MVQYAHTMPADTLPEIQHREDDPPQVTLVASLLGAVLGDFCVKQQLSQSLVATTSDVKLLVRAAQRGEGVPEESALSSGWRAQAVLPELLAVLAGKRSVRVASLTREDPLRIEGHD